MFTYNYKIKFADCDPGGVIYFAKIFDIAHQAYEFFLLNTDNIRDYFNSQEFAIPIVKAEAFYIQPVRLHEDLTIKLFVEAVGTSSFSIKCECEDKNNSPVAEVKTLHVVINKIDGVKTRIPDDLRSHLTTHLSG